MRVPRRVGNLPGLLLLATVLAPPAWAGTVRGEIDSVRSEAGSAQGVTFELRWPEGAAHGELSLRARQLEFPLLQFRATDIGWSCPLQPDDSGGWRCQGLVTLAGRGGQSLDLHLASASTRAELSVGNRAIGFESRAAAPDRFQVDLQRIPVQWLQAFLATLWSEAKWSGAETSGTLAIHAPDAGRLEVEADLHVRGLDLETPDGSIAAAGMKFDLPLVYRQQGARTRIEAKPRLHGGEFLFGALYVQLPATAVATEVVAERSGSGPWRLPKIAWRDGETLRAEGSAALAEDASVRQLLLSVRSGDLGVVRDRYLSGFLAPAGFPDLALSGAASAKVAMQDGQWTAMSLELAQVNVIDPAQRFVMAGVDGGLDWSRETAPRSSRLSWQNAALFGFGLGPMALPFSSEAGELRLAAPASVDVLEGKLELQHLRWQPPQGEVGARFQLGVRLLDLDVASLSQRLGWPPFTGKLNGRIPNARYQDNRLVLDGGLAMEVFDGTVQISQLEMERPFGLAPSLSADVAIDNLDLIPLTRAFGFGEITGRLDGFIRDLRLVDWSPASFHARLFSDPEWQGRRRLSQNAVQDISSVGGSGLIGGLQARALQFFDDFGYERIALGCRLRDDICQMEGVDSAGDGYTIVQGAGLPRIQVVGFRKRVDWPTLVARLEAATEGQAPVIE